MFFYSCVAILAGMEFADFGTGVYHFSAWGPEQKSWDELGVL